MLPPQFYYGAGMLLGKGVKWLLGGVGGKTQSGFTGCHEGWLPGNDEYKWIAIPADQAHHVSISERVWSLQEYVRCCCATARERREWQEPVARELECLRQVCAQYPGHVIFVVQVR